MADKHEQIAKSVEKKYREKDKKKRKKMNVSGKNIFKLQQLIAKKNDSSPKRKNSKDN